MVAHDTEDLDFDRLWNYNDAAKTEGLFRAMLPSMRAAGTVPLLVELLTQIARAEGLQRKFEDAHRTLDEAEALLPDERGRSTIRCLVERGRVWNSSGHKSEARRYFVEAFDLAQAHHEDFYAIDAAHMMGIIEPPDEQLAWNMHAIELANGSVEPRARTWLGSLYNNTGWSYHEREQYAEALALFRAGLEWQQEEGRPRETRIAAWTVARALRSLGHYEEALQTQRENLVQSTGTDEPDGYIQEEIGECLLALGRDDEARGHFARAYAVLSQERWLQESEPERLERLARLGQAH